MKPKRLLWTICALVLLMTMGGSLPSFGLAVRADAISERAWVPQGLQPWGRKNVAVDFGARGLWSYDGRWIQLSRLDPRHMAGWGAGHLAIDFGVHGLWTYNGRVWTRISL